MTACPGTRASGFAHAYCALCQQHNYCSPLHGSAGGPLVCLPCDAPRRRARRVVIKALKAYESVGGRLFGRDFDQIKLVGFNFFGGDTAAAVDFSDLTSGLLTSAIALTHPDKHPPERKAEASRVTQELLALKPFVFPAPEPKPPKPSDAYSKQSTFVLNEAPRAAEPPYPCEDCIDAEPDCYCDRCKGRWQKNRTKSVSERNGNASRKTNASVNGMVPENDGHIE
jgi:hypothetical protein